MSLKIKKENETIKLLLLFFSFDEYDLRYFKLQAFLREDINILYIVFIVCIPYPCALLSITSLSV